MSFLSDRALPASFKGVEFLFLDSSIENGRKNVVHDFPNKDLPFIEDLGAKGRIITVRAVVSGLFYEDNKKDLEAILSSALPGFFVHPYLGQIFCKALSYTVDEDNTKIGVASYSISFQETTGVNVYPAIDATDNKNTIANIYDSIYKYIRDNMSGRLILKYLANIDAYLQKMTDMLNTLNLLSRNKSDTTDISNRDFFKKSKYFNDNKTRFILGKKNIGDGFADMFTSFDLLSDNPENRFNNSLKLAGYSSNENFINIDTKISKERNANLKTMNGVVNTLGLTNILDSVKDLTYTNEDYLTNIALQTERSFQNVMDNEASSFLDTDVYDLMLLIRGEVRKFFEAQKLIVKKLITIQTNKIPLSVLTYKYYGDLDNYNDLLDINDVYNPSVVYGNLRIYEP